jgi:hypothetical protein
MGAVLPTLTTQLRAQAHYFGTAPDLETGISDQWAFLRARGQAGNDPQLAWLEWTGQKPTDTDGRPLPFDLDDEKEWARANPALGIRITREALARDRIAMDDGEFGREHLSLWDGGAVKSALDSDVWTAFEELGSRPGEVLGFGVAVTPDQRSAWIGVAGRRRDGAMHVELVSCCDVHRKTGGWCAGTKWVAKRAKDLDEKWKPSNVVVDPGSPAGALVLDLTNEKVESLRLVSGREYAQACGAFDAKVKVGGVRHIGQPELNAAVGGATWRKLGDAKAWGWKDASVNIAPLIAVTLAAHGAEKKPKKKRRTGKAMSV